MWRTAWASLPGRVGHLLLTLAAIVLGLGTIVALLGLNSMVRSTADGIVAGTTSDVTVVPAGSLAATGAVTSTATMSDDVLKAMLDLPGVTIVMGQIRGGDIFPVDADGRVIDAQLAPTVAGNFIAAQQSEDRPRIGIALGRAPAAPNEVVIDAETLARSGIGGLGSRLTFARPGSDSPAYATVVGILTLGSGRTAGATYALFSNDGARALFLDGRPGWNGAWIEAEPGTDLAGLARQVRELLPEGFEAVDRDRAATATQFQLHPQLGFLQLGLLVAGVVALLVAFGVVRTTIAHLIAHRREDLARLRRLGAGRGQLGLLVGAEVAVLGLIGAVLAIPVGLGLAGVAQTLAANRGYSLGSAEPKLRAIEIVIVLALGPLLALAASRAHLRATLTASPLPARPGYERQGSRFGDGAWTGLGLLLIGIVLLVVVDRWPVLPRLPIWAGVGSVAVLAGAVMALPALGWPLVRAVGGLAQLVLRDAGRLATRNVTRNPARFSRAAAALVLGTGLVATFAVLAQSGRESAAELVPAAMPGDLVVTTTGTGGFSRDLAVQLSLDPGVTAVHAVGLRTALEDGTPRRVVTADPGELEAVYRIGLGAGRAPRAIDEVMLDSDFAAAQGLKTGKTWTLKINQDDVTVRIVGLYDTPDGVDAGNVATLRETFVSRGVPDVDSVVSLDVSGDVDATRERARALAADNPLLQVRTPEEIAADQGDRLSAITSALDSLLGVVALLSVIGITYMLLVAAAGRRREFSALRAAGMHDWQLGAMAALEALLMGAVGAIVGTAAGVLAGWGLVLGAGDDGVATFSLPWDRLWGLVWLGVLVGLAAAVLPAAWTMWVARSRRHRSAGVKWPSSQGSADRGAESAVTADPQT